MKRKLNGILVAILTACLITTAAFAVVDDQSEDMTSVVESPGIVDPKTIGENASTPLEAIISEDGIAEPVPSSQASRPSGAVKAMSAPVAAPGVPVSQPSETSNLEPSAPQPAPVVQEKTEPSLFAEKPATAHSALPNPFPSGLLAIDGFKYPVFLYAPPEYRPDRAYPMIVVAPVNPVSAEEGIRYFKGLADRKNLFILSVYNLVPRGGTTPYQLDDWLLGIMKDVAERFPIDKDKIFIFGKDEGANYAAYLSMKYPERFGAAALVGGGWDGQFSAIMEVRSESEKQVPFLAVFSSDKPEIKQKNQSWMDKLQAKGYPIKVMDVKSSEEFKELEFKKAMFDWLDTTSQKWDATTAEKNKTWKAKVKKGIKDFFTV